jgi:hypothetical protein
VCQALEVLRKIQEFFEEHLRQVNEKMHKDFLIQYYCSDYQKGRDETFICDKSEVFLCLSIVPWRWSSMLSQHCDGYELQVKASFPWQSGRVGLNALLDVEWKKESHWLSSLWATWTRRISPVYTWLSRKSGVIGVLGYLAKSWRGKRCCKSCVFSLKFWNCFLMASLYVVTLSTVKSCDGIAMPTWQRNRDVFK